MLFLPNTKNFKREFKRPLAKGYKRVVIDEAVKFASPCDIVADDETKELRIVPLAVDMDKTPDCLVLLTTEIGLFNGAVKVLKKSRGKIDTVTEESPKKGEIAVSNELSIIPIDNEYFIVKLYSGAVAYNVDGEIILPNLNTTIEPDKLKCNTSKICWINPMWFNSLRKFDDYPQFHYDIEHFVELSGGVDGTGNYTNLKPLKDKDIDMSLGQLALFIEKESVKEAVKTAKDDYINTMKGISAGTIQAERDEDADDFEVDEKEEEEEEENEYYEEEDDDDF